MKTLTLIRGVPGSGKTTFGETFFSKVVSADDYFMVDGVYKFNRNKIEDAHNWCQNVVKERMRIGCPEIAVANTFTQVWEMDAYYRMANEYGYTVFSVIVENRHGGENVHGVPESTVEKMKKRFEVRL